MINPEKTERALRAKFGLDDPIWMRYWHWLIALLQGAAIPAYPTLRTQLVGGNREAKISGESPIASTSHYLTGSSKANWHTDVPHYSRVRYSAVYPGIDLVYHGDQQQMEYDFVVAPHRDGHQAQFVEHPMPPQPHGGPIGDTVEWALANLDRRGFSGVSPLWRAPHVNDRRSRP